MYTIKIHGASDDLIEIEGKGGGEFYADGDDSKPVGVFNIGGMMRVFALYVRGGVWAFAVSQVDEEVPLPDWPVRIIQCPHVAYSTQAEIDVPDNVVVFCEKNEE